MRWLTFLTLASFLFVTNIAVNAQVNPSALSQQIPNFQVPTEAINETLAGINPSAFARLPTAAQSELSRRQNAAIDAASTSALRSNPITTGALPLPNNSTLPFPTSSPSSPSSSSTARNSTSQAGTIDPLSAGMSYVQTQDATYAQLDTATLDTANKRELHLWKSYTENIYDQLNSLKLSYLQTKYALQVFNSRLDAAMLNKLPATIPNCVKPS